MITLAKFAAPATVGVHAVAIGDRIGHDNRAGEVAYLAAAYTARQFDADWNPYPVNVHGVNLVANMTGRNCLASLAEYLRDMRA